MYDLEQIETRKEELESAKDNLAQKITELQKELAECQKNWLRIEGAYSFLKSIELEK